MTEAITCAKARNLALAAEESLKFREASHWYMEAVRLYPGGPSGIPESALAKLDKDNLRRRALACYRFAEQQEAV